MDVTFSWQKGRAYLWDEKIIVNERCYPSNTWIPVSGFCCSTSFPDSLYWTLSLGWKGPIKYVPSVFLSVLSVLKFFRDWLISFFWNLGWCWGPMYSCVRESWIFSKKSPSSKNDQKWSKIALKQGFWTF